MSGWLLVADSGSTKTDWCLARHADETAEENNNGQTENANGQEKSPSAKSTTTTGRVEKISFSTQGLNPYQLSPAELRIAIGTSYEWVRFDISAVRFYGAGCTREKADTVEETLRAAAAPTADIRVESDMMGAARALLGDEAGLVGILGTGSNSCLYDGRNIVANVSPLGYILGDEGSGAYIGRRLIGNCLKRQFGEELCETFLKETGLDAATVTQRVYRMPQPNRFLASLMPFCEAHREMEEMHDFLVDCFREFFVRNVSQYHRPDLSVNFIGSVATIFNTELREAAHASGFSVGRVIKNPLPELVSYELCKSR